MDSGVFNHHLKDISHTPKEAYNHHLKDPPIKIHVKPKTKTQIFTKIKPNDVVIQDISMKQISNSTVGNKLVTILNKQHS